jgi:RNA polymerase sigma-70 factor (ECF subfamily)
MHEDVSFRAAYLIVRDSSEAEDVTQEAFIRAYKALERFDPEQPFRPWLLRIVTNLSFNSTRGSKRRHAMTERVAAQAPRNGASGPELAAEAADEARLVWEAVGALPKDDQELIYLRYFLDQSEQEMAAAIRRPAGTVKSRLHRALRRLRAVIEERYPELRPEAVEHMSGGRA